MPHRNNRSRATSRVPGLADRPSVALDPDPLTLQHHQLELELTAPPAPTPREHLTDRVAALRPPDPPPWLSWGQERPAPERRWRWVGPAVVLALLAAAGLLALLTR